jgi:hypothetical protein
VISYANPARKVVSPRRAGDHPPEVEGLDPLVKPVVDMAEPVEVSVRSSDAATSQPTSVSSRERSLTSRAAERPSVL